MNRKEWIGLSEEKNGFDLVEKERIQNKFMNKNELIRLSEKKEKWI